MCPVLVRHSPQARETERREGDLETIMQQKSELETLTEKLQVSETRFTQKLGLHSHSALHIDPAAAGLSKEISGQKDQIARQNDILKACPRSAAACLPLSVGCCVSDAVCLMLCV